MKVLVISGSSRDLGNTELLTEKVVEGLDCTWVYLRKLNIRRIVDQRHTPAGFSPVDDDLDGLIRQVIDHDVIVFATPLYWYGMSGAMKDFIDRWSQSRRDPRFDFEQASRTKQAYVVVTGGSDARFKALAMIQQFVHIFDFAGMEFANYLIGTGGKPGEILQDERALLEAGWLNRMLRQKAEL